MRNSFVKALCEIAEYDENIYLIAGDLGYGVLTSFWEKYPERFINAGISEQNMSSVAAGMALDGNTVFTYSIANFPTIRCLEQIRNDIAYHEANVKIIAVGAGFAYGSAGMSHHATEDIAILRALPNMKVFSPADPIETAQITKLISKIKDPCYLRLGKGGEKALHSSDVNIEIGKAYQIRQGREVAILSTGAITEEALEASEILDKCGIGCSVYSFPTIKPIDIKCIIDASINHQYIFTLEEHNIVGGFGSAVMEVLAELPQHTPVIRFGLNDEYCSIVGDQKYLRDCFNISSTKIANRIKKVVYCDK